MKLIPKLRILRDLQVRAEFTCEVEAVDPVTVVNELKTVIEELGLGHSLRVEQVQRAEPIN
ncbi:MAG TPA: hypothetical protein VFE42_25965 [Chloroflexota bacterium]|jgi:hypothetical protein|nr:hypothetical protein [Chloroflexota bacterium]